MLLDGLNANLQLGGNLFIRFAFGNKLRTSRSRGVNRLISFLLSLPFDWTVIGVEMFGDTGTIKCSPIVQSTNSPGQKVGRSLFDQVTTGAYLSHVLDIFLVAMSGKDQHFCFGQTG